MGLHFKTPKKTQTFTVLWAYKYKKKPWKFVKIVQKVHILNDVIGQWLAYSRNSPHMDGTCEVQKSKVAYSLKINERLYHKSCWSQN